MKKCKLLNPENLTYNDYCIICFIEENKLNINSRKSVEQFIKLINNDSSNDIVLDKIKEDTKIKQVLYELFSDSKFHTITDVVDKGNEYNYDLDRAQVSHYLNHNISYTRECIGQYAKAYFKYSGNIKEELLKKCEKINEYISLYNLIPLFNLEDTKSFFQLENDNIDDIMIKLNKNNKIQDVDDDNSKIKNDKQSLTKYMKKIIDIESDIYSLQKRFSALEKNLKDEVDSNLIIDSFCMFLNYIDEINRYKIDNYNNVKPLLASYTSKISIEKPTFNYIKPQKPELKKAGIFNKKKIENENDMILKEYDNQCQKYEEAKNKYELLLKEYEEEYNSQLNKANEDYESALKEYEKVSNQRKEELELKKAEFEKIKSNPINFLNDKLSDSASFRKAKNIVYEMNYIIYSLDKLVNVKEQLYSQNIIYGKYRNYIALSSIIDYYLSGRCESLDGKDGAYNLYEQESRSDIIINKMDVIIDKLDTISKNQYYLYSKLNEVNDSLNNISGLLMVNDILQAVQISELYNIIENVDKIAYNTEVTSYYAEKTAHYSEALAYLKLLNG